MTRFAYCQCRLRKVFGSVFKRFDWHNIVVIYDVNDAHSDVLGETLKVGLQKGGIYPYMIQYYSKKGTDVKMLLRVAAANARGRCLNLQIYVRTYIHKDKNTYIHTYIHTNIHRHTHTYVHTYRYIHIYMYIHTRTHLITHTHTRHNKIVCPLGNFVACDWLS